MFSDQHSLSYLVTMLHLLWILPNNTRRYLNVMLFFKFLFQSYYYSLYECCVDILVAKHQVCSLVNLLSFD